MMKCPYGNYAKLLVILCLFFSKSSFGAKINVDSLEIVLAEKKGDARIEILVKLSNYYFRYDQFKAIKFAEEVVSFGNKNDDSRLLRDGNKFLAYSYDFLGQYEMALQYYDKYLLLLKIIDDKENISSILNSMGVLNRYLGNYDKSLTCYLEALKILEDMGDEKAIAATINNIGIIYFYILSYDEALLYVERALKLYQKLDSKEDLADCYVMTGNIFTEKKELKKALEYYKKSITIYHHLKNKEGLADVYNNVGNLHTNLKEYAAAEDYYLKSLAIEEELENKKGIAASLNNLGSVSLNLGKYDLAIDYCQRSLALAAKSGYLWIMENANLIIARSYAKKKNFYRAYRSHVDFSKVKEKLFGEEVSSKVAELKHKYEAEKKQREIELLKKDKNIRELEISAQINRQKVFKGLTSFGAFFVVIVFFLIYSKLRSERKSRSIIEKEKEKSDKLLLNILPDKVAEELKQSGKSIPESFDNVTVLFSDLVNFSAIASEMEPRLLIDELNDIFTAFDNINEKNNCQRIKTIGDAYLSVCGLPEDDVNHTRNIIRSAVAMIDYLKKRNEKSAIKWEVRIGIHTGVVVGGVVGVKKYIYDVFGDTINIASRMQERSVAMKINVTEQTFLKAGDDFKFVDRGFANIKNIGSLRMYYVENS